MTRTVDQRVSVVGLGRLGAPLAACLAERGFQTLGIDINEGVLASLAGRRAPFHEPGLDELLGRHAGGRLRLSADGADAIRESDVTFIIVATPSCVDGTFSNHQVEAALRTLGKALRASTKPHHLFVISSTVMPGSTERSFIPLLEEFSGRRCGLGLGVCFDPDFVALGRVVAGFLAPDLVIIGESSHDDGTRVEAIHRQLCTNQPVISHMSVASAEIAKVCLNAFITLKISFANSVANLCERITGADCDAITQAIGADRRISPHYFRGGLSFGGTCFPRDTHAFAALARQCGQPGDLIEAAGRVNAHQDAHLARLVSGLCRQRCARRVAVLGLAFTSDTSVVVESAAMKLVAALVAGGLNVCAYDRLASEAAREEMGDSIEYAASVDEALDGAEVVVLCGRDPALRRAVERLRPPRPMAVVDCWRLLDSTALDERISVVAIGRHQDGSPPL